MNHVYRIIWNHAKACFEAVAETASGRGKRSLGKRQRPVRALALAAGLAAAQALAAPTGGQVSAGQGSITQNAATTTITQTTGKLAINWQSFGIASNETVNFVQPGANAVALNRVLGTEASQILGRLNANGQVFLLNPNGVLFGQGAQVSVGGLVASTLGMSDADFLAGRYVLRTSGGNSASVRNEGTIIAADGGSIALIGGQVSNTGSITARLGNVTLAAGKQVTLDFSGDGLLKLAVDEGAVNALVSNGGLVQADGGTALLTARAADVLAGTVVNNTGIVRARTIENQGGVIKLLGGFNGGTVQVGGLLDASAPDGGDGGFIDTSGAKVKVAEDARVDTRAAQGKTGTWLIDPADFTIAASGGDISGATLSSNLGSSNVSILSSSGSTATGNGDIHVNDAVSWSANTLTLTAARDININSVMTANGSSALVMNTATANGADAGVAGGTVKVGLNTAHTAFTGRVDFDRSGSGFLTINGNGYTVINDLGAPGSVTATDLQGMAGNLGGYYALGANIDASATSGWNAGAGFAPVGSAGTTFTGMLDGLGHSINSLTASAPSTNLGLFGRTTGATLRNLELAGGLVSGNDAIGALAGEAIQTVLHNILSSATVRGQTAGGIVGFMSESSLTDVHSTGVVGNRPPGTLGSRRGGLIGLSEKNTILRVSASGNVEGAGGSMGGLIGESIDDIISHAQASGSITGDGNRYGGLIGKAAGSTISDSEAHGNLTGAASLVLSGGLVGEMLGGSITRSFAEGHVTSPAGSQAGGLVGYNTGTVTDAHATGDVDVGGDNVGGLIGDNTGALTRVRAEGDVSGGNRVGGLAGNHAGAAINGAKALGDTVSGTGNYVGGLVGYNAGGAISGTDLAPASATAAVTGALDWVGGAVGYSTNANLSYLSAGGATRSVSGQRVGGLVGELAGGTINHGTASGAVSGTGELGGLVGRTTGNVIVSRVIDSQAAGSVTATGGFANARAGGLVGMALSTEFRDVEATGAVTTSGNQTGGLIGILTDGFVEGGIARGNVSGRDMVGGLVGLNLGPITNSRAYGNVTATSTSGGVTQAGGLVGSNNSDITDSFAIGSVSGTGSQIGGLVGANLANIVLTNTHATGSASGSSEVGGLVGLNNGTILNSYATGTATATTSNAGGLIGSHTGSVTDAHATGHVNGVDNTGGLIGSNAGSVNNAYYATGTVTGTGSNTGGLIGSNTVALSGVRATGAVNGVTNTGGLIGYNTASLSNAHATGAVSGTTATGGLVGFSDNLSASPIDLSQVYATGNVSGGLRTGGLIGFSSSTGAITISQAHATGNVSGTSGVGGLAGVVDGNNTISDAYATGTVSGTSVVGGLIGRLDQINTATRVFATGDVTGTDTIVGGLVGYNLGTISDAYASGAVTSPGATPRLGGLVGRNHSAGVVQRVYAAGYVANNGSPAADDTTGAVVGENLALASALSELYYDSDAVGGYRAIGGTTSNAGRLNSTAAKVQASYAGFDFASTWTIYPGNTYPLLRSFMTPLTVTANNASKTYDGALWSGGNGVGYSSVPNANLLGTLAYGGTAQGARNAGSYSLAATGLYSHQLGYLINYVGGTLTVDPKSISVTASGADKVYDGAATAGVSLASAGLVSGDTVNFSNSSALFADKNAGANKAINVSGISISASGAGANYVLSNTSAVTSASITPAALAVSGISAANKVYDATTAAIVNTSGANYAGLIANDVVEVTATGSFVDKHVGNGKTVNLSSSYTGADVGNYSITDQAITSANVTPAALTVSGITANNKVYDATTAATVNTLGASYAGLIANDVVAVSATGSFADKNVGNGKTVNLSSSYSGADAGNYSITDQASTTASISPKALTVSGITAADKIYDGNTAATVSTAAANYAGLVTGDALTVNATGTFADKNAANGKTVALASSYGGADVGNYTITGQATTTASITPKALTVSGITAADRIYDGTTAASINSAGATYSGLIGGDDLAVTVTGSFADKHVAAGKTVTLAGNYSGADAGNYAISGQTTTTASITPAALTVTAQADNRVYDGTTASAAGPLVTGTLYDTVASAAVQSFDNKNAGTGKTLSAAGLVMNDGNGGNNYSISYVGNTSGVITPASLWVVADDQSKQVYTPDPLLTYRTGPFAVGDSAATVLSGTLQRAAGEQPGAYAINQGLLAANGNYLISYTPGSLSITAGSPAGSSATPYEQVKAQTPLPVPDFKQAPLCSAVAGRDNCAGVPQVTVVDEGLRMPVLARTPGAGQRAGTAR